MISKEQSIKLRKQYLGPACTLFFKHDPLKIIRSSRQYLYNEKDEKFLDCINNVQHVGHSHPAVVDAITKQLSETSCNNRYLHDSILLCAERLHATLPSELNKFFFCNSGSEANDLAMRICGEFTGGTEVICVDHAYHGHISSTMAISPYKFDGPGGSGKPDHVYVAPVPDVYRGRYRLETGDLQNPLKLAEVGRKYALSVKELIDQIQQRGRKLSCFIIEALQSCGGQIIPPPGYLASVAEFVHAAGGLVIIDEVQTGFGRAGKTFWSFQLDGKVVPDVLTLGKSMGNGFPVSAVAVKGHIADHFGNKGQEYFNTYGGNPVSCAAALAVLNVLEKEKLQQNAANVGEYLLQRLRALSSSHRLIGDVRGVGLFIGIDLVKDRNTREPASDEAEYIIYRMKDKHIILSRDGPYCNVLKIKPPMCFSCENADELCDALDEILAEAEKGDILLQQTKRMENGGSSNKNGS